MKNKELSVVLMLATIAVLGAETPKQEVSVPRIIRNFSLQRIQKKYPTCPHMDKYCIAPNSSLYEDEKKKAQKKNGSKGDKFSDKRFRDPKTRKLSRQARNPQEIKRTKGLIYS